MKIKLGSPYEAIIERLIKREYADRPEEVLRHGLQAYGYEIDRKEQQ